ncbi:hypothetical protein [Piscinibacter sp.]|jgi:hypothetical protein|uniref:hypothetical protein n=1 Tax=Piscinibacter sp. TaxID=1903157 RepID=UPI002F3FE9D7
MDLRRRKTEWHFEGNQFSPGFSRAPGRLGAGECLFEIGEALGAERLGSAWRGSTVRHPSGCLATLGIGLENR